jgi:hypothetical protein
MRCSAGGGGTQAEARPMQSKGHGGAEADSAAAGRSEARRRKAAEAGPPAAEGGK